MTSRGLLLTGAVLAGGFFACQTAREPEPRAPTPFLGRVETLLATQCVRCHAGSAPAGGFRADSYLHAIGCTSSGAAATVSAPGAPRPAILVALDRPDHAGFLRDIDRATLASWIAEGTG
jgi:hypothetical protein